jgi:DNA integrity scanning protein DisA with diadenylate cyclase activity
VTKGYDKCISLFLGRGAKTIQVYKSDKKVANIFISEYSGEWVVRFDSEVKNEMKRFVPDEHHRNLETVADVCLALANNNYGGIFVFGPRAEIEAAIENKLREKPTRIGYAFPASIADVGPDLLQELAKLDGATFIDHHGNILRTNFVILGGEMPKAETDDETAEVLQRGARHTAGVIASYTCRDSLVIIISENGGITLLQDGSVKARDL